MVPKLPWNAEALVELVLAGFQFTKPVGHAPHIAAAVPVSVTLAGPCDHAGKRGW